MFLTGTGGLARGEWFPGIAHQPVHLGDCWMRALFWLVLLSGGALWFDGAYCSGQHTQDAIQMFNDVISLVG
jgi:hypothetical protein